VPQGFILFGRVRGVETKCPFKFAKAAHVRPRPRPERGTLCIAIIDGFWRGFPKGSACSAERRHGNNTIAHRCRRLLEAYRMRAAPDAI
jgi:hypothetical protein